MKIREEEGVARCETGRRGREREGRGERRGWLGVRQEGGEGREGGEEEEGVAGCETGRRGRERGGRGGGGGGWV